MAAAGMFNHADIWQAVDRLAAKHGLSTSGLARRAGLDPTAFNKSKRLTPAGRARWPSTESLAKILAATGASLSDFVELMGQPSSDLQAARLPVLSAGQWRALAHDDRVPSVAAAARSELQFVGVRDPKAFALEVEGNDLLPVYRDGAVLVVSPSAPIRPGDRVVMRTAARRMIVATIDRHASDHMDVTPIAAVAERTTIRHGDVAWCGRILWASQ